VLPEPTADRLEFSRWTRRAPGWSVAYRAVRLAVLLFGERRTFAALAGLSRLLHRLSFESALRLFGLEFADTAMPLDDDLLNEVIGPETRVVDLGCGIGRYTRRLAPRVHFVVAIDHNPKNLEVARGMTVATNVEYRLGDARALADDEVFDVAVVVHLLEHIEDPMAFLKDLRGVVRCLVIEVPDFEGDPVNRARLAAGVPFATDPDHVREYTEATLKATLAESGWRADVIRKRGGAIAAIAR
jgi:SAM-dependent methyltransferase